MKLALGTAQLARGYGAGRQASGAPPVDGARVLRRARELGIEYVDTAHNYGDSEALIGAESAGHSGAFSVVTKIPPLPRTARAAEHVERSVRGSLERLRSDRVHAVLVHVAADLLGPQGARLWDALEAEVAAGRIERLGVSVYDGDEIEQVLERFPVELVQAPLNALDQRLLRSGHLARLREAGVEVHARSLFLQGLLAMDPAGLPAAHRGLGASLAELRRCAADAGLSILEACVGFVSSRPEVDVAVIGVDTPTQLDELVGAARRSVPPSVFARLPELAPRQVDPRRWAAATT